MSSPLRPLLLVGGGGEGWGGLVRDGGGEGKWGIMSGGEGWWGNKMMVRGKKK